ncbi:MAG: MerR family transcriptional regulator [Brumimicrobium sp.]
MLIGEIVNKTGLTKDTIRFYEKHGLIRIGRKDRRENNYKEYSEEVLNRLLTIKRLKGFGFTLNEISDVLDMIEIDQANCNNMKGKIEDKVDLLDVKIRELIEVRSLLLKGASKCQSGCTPSNLDANCGVLVTDEFRFKG